MAKAVPPFSLDIAIGRIRNVDRLEQAIADIETKILDALEADGLDDLVLADCEARLAVAADAARARLRQTASKR